MTNITTLRDGSAVEDPRLDRLKQFDPRSLSYPIQAIQDKSQPRSYTWPLDITLDQGREGACVGFSVAHELRAVPRKVADVDAAMAMRLYKRAQFLDPWVGEDYSGTSVLAGVKAAQEQGSFAEYRWAFNVNELSVAVSRTGPAIIGINWHYSMYRPTYSNNRWWITQENSPIVGGHALLVRGFNVSADAFCLHNSWGPGWGDNGKAWITRSDLGALLASGGEACIPVLR